jgi:hypothetical protein
LQKPGPAGAAFPFVSANFTVRPALADQRALDRTAVGLQRMIDFGVSGRCG